MATPYFYFLVYTLCPKFYAALFSHSGIEELECMIHKYDPEAHLGRFRES